MSDATLTSLPAALLLSGEPGEAEWAALYDWCEERGDAALRAEMEGREPTPNQGGGNWSWRTDACDNPFGRDPYVLPDRVFLRLAGGVATNFPQWPPPDPGTPSRTYWRHYQGRPAALLALRRACVAYAEGLAAAGREGGAR